jgi:outer membrane protein assembly factor BamB
MRSDGGIYSIPLVENNTVYVASLDKKIYAIDIDTWKDRWVYETHGRIFGAPVIAGRSLWCGSNDGRLYELDPQNGKLRSFFQATERIMSKLAYNTATHRIFVRTVANEIYCLKITSLALMVFLNIKYKRRRGFRSKEPPDAEPHDQAMLLVLDNPPQNDWRQFDGYTRLIG